MSEPPVRVGIVGLGGIGHHHADRLEEHGADLVGGVDIDAEARQEFSEEWNVPTYSDIDDILTEIDALFVTTPNKYHEDYATAGLNAGLDVLLEKPVAHTLDSAERIADSAAASDGFCMVGFNNRFAAPVEVATAYRDEGRFGDITHVEANYVRRRGIPGRGSWFTSKEVAGGGALIDIGVHAIDLALHFLDFPTITEVSATTRAQFGTREDYGYLYMWGDDEGPEAFDVEDSASAFLRAEDGRTVSLEVAWAANRPRTDEFVLRGSDGGAIYDRKSEELTIYESGSAGSDHLTETAVDTADNNTHLTEVGYFLEHVAADEVPERNTISEGLAVQRVIDAIYRSAEDGRAVELD
ncbi:Gfo/Idh/MocA family oxidoreductase [Halonotius terrestris]|uniref:Gfo/Idh/MocA family oxidoreductase n=1 Tax=Halonotius terrestris TaxID=2487750 RepID=A0A8J8P7E1_9EURY|nr:Gfo/Idh/MocA family oxidoreductase [Halonotius terrestris]TQQ79208.1 Gfo/Idh/MocA family oxidoreductase [Halonotius terrestris]